MLSRPAFRLCFAAGEPLELGRRTAVMGIVNVTPDSFSDGGRHRDPQHAVAAGLAMADAGADLIDVGGESTRPGATPVPPDEEARRVLPVIEGLARAGAPRISIDTRRATVARQALDAGADLVNDVSAMADPEMLPLLIRRGAPVVLMHLRGEPRTMQRDTRYDDLPGEVLGFLAARRERAVSAGLPDDKIVVDPGIGFGKSAAGSLQLLHRIPALQSLRCPILIGASRKSFIGAALGLAVDERLEASLAVAALASSLGAHIIRAHDVGPTVRAVRMIDAIRDH